MFAALVSRSVVLPESAPPARAGLVPRNARIDGWVAHGFSCGGYPKTALHPESVRSAQLAWLWLSVVLFATHAAAAADPTPKANVEEVIVTTIADAAVPGRLRAFSLTEGLKLEVPGDTVVTTVPADEVVQLVVTHARAQTDSSRGRRGPVEVRLLGGDRLFGEPVRSPNGAEPDPDEETVLFDTAILGTLEVPLPFLNRWVNPICSPLSRRTQNSALAGSPDDRLLLANGDVAHGILLAIGKRGVTFESEGVAMIVPHAQIAVVELVPEAPPQRSGLRAAVTFVDGSCLTTYDLNCTGGELTLTLFDNARHTVGLERVTRIDLTGGRWVWISDLEPISIQHTPMLSLDWPYVKDANVLGGPLRIAHRTFQHGIGVHSESSLMYDLGGKYGWLVAHFGIDDLASGPPGLADAIAEIRVDGQVRHRQEHVAAGRLWGPVRIDVGGAARIELRVLFGENASIQDRFNWADVGLIRARPM